MAYIAPVVWYPEYYYPAYYYYPGYYEYYAAPYLLPHLIIVVPIFTS